MRNKIIKIYLPLLLMVVALSLCVLSACTNEPITNDDNSPDEYKTKFDYSYAEGSPIPNLEPGIYYENQTLSVDVPDGATVYYTTTGKVPTKRSSKYTEPIELELKRGTDNSGVTVYNYRFAAFKGDTQIGETVTASYIMANDEKRFTTKVISLVTPPESLYGDTGIFTNYNMKGRESERAATLSVYGENGELVALQNVGMRVHGTGSRINVQKNIRIFARRDYSPLNGHFKYALFPGLISDKYSTLIDEYETFLIRGGASNFGNTLITNLVAYEIFNGTNVDSANFEPVAFFVNGSYYGMMMLCEDYSPYYFESRYGLDSNKIATINYTVVDNAVTWEMDDGSELEYEEWHRVRRFMYINDMTDDAMYKEACSLMDMDNFIDYIITECYLNNWDWPRNNVRVWRYTGVPTSDGGVGGYNPDATYGYDGKWRFVAKDLDITLGVTVNKGLGYASNVSDDFFDILNKDSACNHRLDVMFNSLMNNTNFREKFITRLCQLMSTNLSKDNCLDIINKLELQVSNEVKYHSVAFGETLEYWDASVQWMRDFSEQRTKYVINSMKTKQGFIIKPVTIPDFEGGTVTINGVAVDGKSTIYVEANKEYSIVFTPFDGYEFDTASYKGCSVKNGKITVKNVSTISVTPSFKYVGGEKSEEALPEVCINEIGHSTSEAVNDSDWIELYNSTDKDITLNGYVIVCGNKECNLNGITVPAKGYKVFFCDGSNKGGIYLPFKISAGETVTLSNTSINYVETIEINPSKPSYHIARYPDGGNLIELTRYEITPGESNTHYTETFHSYDECNYNTVLFNGWLVDNDFFTVGEDGGLYITAGKLNAVYEAYLEILKKDLKVDKTVANESKATAKRFVEKILADYSDNDNIAVSDIISSFTSKTKVYYLDEFNTYVICTCHEQNVK